MACKACGSGMECKFNGEIAIHLPGPGGREKPLIWVFQELFVCMSSGNTEFIVPETNYEHFETHCSCSAMDTDWSRPVNSYSCSAPPRLSTLWPPATPLRHNIGGQNVIQANIPSRRLTSRVEVSEEVWVYWSCDGREDVSRVRNLSLGGLFVETSETRPVGITANPHFLVQEGPIRADALVRHATATSGLGVKFLAVKEADRPKLASLVTRLRTSLRSKC